MAKKKLNLNRLFGSLPFNADKHLKYKLSMSFWADSNDFLWRAGILLKERPYDTNAYFAKIYVDLIMSAECALKSLIISLSLPTESPEVAYLTARKIGHNLEKLYTEVELRGKKRLKLLSPRNKKILFKANKLGVNYRYEITKFFFLTQEDYIDRAFQRGFVSSVINFEFISLLYNMLHDLNELASKSHHKYYGKYSSLSGSNIKKQQDRQNAFFTTMRNKL